jgi:hypothetical protein
MRFILYWLTSTFVAVLCMKAAATPNSEMDFIAVIDPAIGLTAPDPTRAIMLGVGIMAMAYTYQRVWANFRTAERRG